jgi:hypothetical protein
VTNTTNSATISSLANNTLYNVMVVAYNSSITSIQSANASFTTGPPPPGSPSFSNIMPTSVTVSFDPSTNATSYRIYYDSGTITSSSLYVTTTINSASITGLTPGFTYNVLIIAFNSSGSTSDSLPA